MTAAASNDRLHALDAVRGFALTLGVFFHASMSYLPGPQIWMVKDADSSAVLGGTFFVLHIFRMTLFFLLAGFFGRMLFEKRGAAGFIRDRARRIALPLVAFWPIVMACIGLAVAAAWVMTHPGQAPPAPPKMPPQDGIPFPLTHLWFLYVLIWFYVAAVALRRVTALLDRSGAVMRGVDGTVGLLVRSPLSPAVLMIPLLAGLWISPVWMMWFGIQTPDMNLIPNIQALAAYGTAFLFGWLLHRRAELLQVFVRRWPLNLGLSLVLIATCLYIAGPAPILAPAPRTTETYLFALCYGGAIWSTTFAILGLALRFLSAESPARRYLADASYWIYIVHLPLVILLQGVAGMVGLPWWIEYPALLAVAFALMIPSYHLQVRYTWLGAILNGRRASRPVRPPAAILPREA